MQTPEDVFGMLEAAKLRWMTGGAAEIEGNVLAARQDGAEAQLRLLAQAAVFRQACLRPTVPDGATVTPRLPEPDLPLLPQALRPTFRTMMQQQDRGLRQGLIDLMVMRGVMAHPFDWMPPKDMTGYPDAYVPLAKWRAGAADDTALLSADTWDEMYPADRRNAFTALRTKDAAAARLLMETQGASLPAAERLALIDVFTIGLGPDDVPYLETLATSDRSQNVKARASALLARLGVVNDDDDTRELVDFLERSTSGLLRRRKVIGLRDKLNPAQGRRANDLFQTVAFSNLADALGITDESLADSYVTAPQPEASSFMNLCIRTAPFDWLMRYWTRLRADGGATFAMLAAMKDRLTRDQLLKEAQNLLGSAALTDLGDLLSVTGADVGVSLSEALITSAAYRGALAEVKSALHKRSRGDEDHAAKRVITLFETFAMQLALMVSADHAKRILRDLEAAGFHNADPVLRPLKFNIALQGSAP